MVHAVISRTPKSAGCGGIGGLPIQEAYEAANKALADAVEASGGDALIHVNYDYRVSSQTVGCNNQSKAVFEVYGWGTAVRLK